MLIELMRHFWCELNHSLFDYLVASIDDLLNDLFFLILCHQIGFNYAYSDWFVEFHLNYNNKYDSFYSISIRFRRGYYLCD